MKIKKGDTVIILAGKDFTKTGKVEKVLRGKNKAIIKGLNIFKKHTKHSKKTPKGGIIDVAMPIDISNLGFVCPKCEKKVKIGKKSKNGKRTRICKKCGASID